MSNSSPASFHDCCGHHVLANCELMCPCVKVYFKMLQTM